MKHKIQIDRVYLFDPAAWGIVRAKIGGMPSDSVIQAAITKAVKKYEMLNCSITQDESGECYYSPNKQWSAPDITFVSQKLTEETIFHEQKSRLFNFQHDKLIRFVVNTEPSGLYLTIIQHHLTGDGESILLLLQDIMKFMQEDLKPDSEDTEPEQQVPIKLYTSEYLKQFITPAPDYNKILKEINDEWSSLHSIYRFEDYHILCQKHAANKEIGIKTAKITDYAYTAFCRKCKANNVTVNSALTTMIVKHLRTIENLAMAVSIRTKDFPGMGNYVSAISGNYTYNQNDSFWNNARQISKTVSKKLENRMALSLPLFYKGLCHTGIQDAPKFGVTNDCIRKFSELTGPGTGGYPVFISNLGNSRIAADYGKYSIQELSVISPPLTGLFGNICIISIRNCMTLNMVYQKNEIDYPELFDSIIRQINQLI